MTRLPIPTLDVNTTHATLTAWHVQPGATVKTGDLLAELTTDKAAFDLESPCDGTLLQILAPEKSILPTGYILALIGTPGETDPAAAEANARLLQSLTAPVAPASSPSPSHPPALHKPEGSPGRVPATPKARRLAQQHNINLADVQAKTGATLIDEQTLRPFLPGN